MVNPAMWFPVHDKLFFIALLLSEMLLPYAEELQEASSHPVMLLVVLTVRV